MQPIVVLEQSRMYVDDNNSPGCFKLSGPMKIAADFDLSKKIISMVL